MYPLALKEKGLVTTVREYVFEWENRTDIQADVRIENECRLSLEIEQAIYRIIQEALSNVARHSQATQVEVVISYSKNVVEAAIIDNGCGFTPDRTPMGMGLRSIRERVESIDGNVHIESAPGHGSRVTVRVPLG
jgi:signal transduction histidine kinase